MSSTPYIELHAHSAFSFLDGASLPEELIAAAVEHGHSALALTDHDNLSGAMEFAQAAKGLGLRAIHGCELSLSGGSHLTLLVEDASGWANLCRILTIAHAETRSGPPGAPATPPESQLQTLLGHSKGIVCLTGCADHGIRDDSTARQLLEGFGSDHLRVELQRPLRRGDRERNRLLEQLASRIGVPTVATGNVHIHNRSRGPLQDAFVAIRLRSTLDASEPQRRGNRSHTLSTPQAMAARFADHPRAVAETLELAGRLDFDLTSSLGYRHPREGDLDADRELAAVCGSAFETRYGQARPHLRAEAKARLEEELRVIAGLGLAGFFLLHRDLLELARDVAAEVRGPDTARALLPPGRGRGSSVSSIVCHLTGLSHVDPIANGLQLGRFLNDDLSSTPDIDLDFPRDIRAKLIPRVHERYGKDRTALVATFPTFRARSAIRQIGAALSLPAADIERVARASEGWSGQRVGDDIKAALGDRGESPRWQWLARLAAEAHGLPRHLSQHPGGMIVAAQPLTACCPVVPSAMEGRRIVQWDKDSCSDAGFLKIDLLGLGMLSAVERCIELVWESRRERLDLSQLPLDDKPTFEAIRKAETTGVFQIESRAQMSSLLRTQPQTIDDITIQVAIVRPGPIQGGAVNPYIRRRRLVLENPGLKIEMPHPSLEAALGETLGTIIFQDQVLEVSAAFAGFTTGEAEGLRRAMSRKRSSAAVEAYRLRFIAGAQQLHGVNERLASEVFTMIRGFSGFGFPKAHAAAFGLLAYQSTWLRVHRPAEFLCALIDEQPMGFYPPDSLVHEAQRRGVKVLPPDTNLSRADSTIEEGAVRIGLNRVKGASSECVAAVVAQRLTGGPYSDSADLASRSGAARPTLEALAWAGACDSLAGSRRAALWELGAASLSQAVGENLQLALPLGIDAPELNALDAWGRAVADYSTTGIAIEGNPVGLLRAKLSTSTVTATGLAELPDRARVTVAGLVVVRQRPQTAGGIVFLLIEDETGTINIVLRKEVYERHRLEVRTEPMLLIDGILERPAAAGGGISVLATQINRLPREQPASTTVKADFAPEPLVEAAAADRAEHFPRASSSRGGR